MTSKSELNQFTATKATPDTLPQRVAERRTLALGGLGWTFESYDSFLLSLLLPVLGVVFGINKTELGLFISVTAGGQIIGGILFGFIADKIGRVKTALTCIAHLFTLFRPVSLYARSTTFRAVTFLRRAGYGRNVDIGRGADCGNLAARAARARRRADANGVARWRDSGHQPDGNRQLG